MFITREIRNILEKSAATGCKRLQNGAELIGHVPHVGEDAYLHAIFSGLQNIEIKKIESELQISLPPEYEKFLEEHNGFILFQGAISLSGLPANNNRTISDRQPFSLRDDNMSGRPRGSSRGDFFIGSYDWDGSLLFMTEPTKSVYLRRRDDSAVRWEWPSLGVMISSEVARLAEHYDEVGREIDPKWSTLPDAVRH